jgi:acetyltransferase
MKFSENNSSQGVRQVSSRQQRAWCQQPPVTVRRVDPHDYQLLTDLLARLSDRSHRQRYMLPRSRAAEALEREARRMVLGATGDHVTLIVLSQPPGSATALAVGELARDHENPTSAEVAIMVRDDVQGQGIGTLLGTRLLQAAERLGITTIRADLLVENSASLRLIRRLGVPFRIIPSRGTLQLVLSCDQPGGDSDAR